MREMKDSLIPWLGEIPKEWNVLKVKNIASRKSDKNMPDEQVLSLYRELGIVIKSERDDNHNVTSENTNNYKFVEVDNLVVNKMKAWQGSIAVSGYQGIVSPAYYVYKFKDKNIYPWYVHYVLRCKAYLPEYRRLSGGIRLGQWDLSDENFKNIPLPVPSSIEEQKRIADYLDDKCSQIDSIIEKQKAIIEKLKEYKLSVITEAVTKGLNPNVEMKDSGIEWIGDIPKHWDIRRTKFVSDSLTKGNGITKDDVVIDGDIQCIRYGEIYSKYDGKVCDCISYTKLDKISQPKYIEKGDILFAGTGELITEIGKNIVYMGEKACLAGGDIVVMKHKQNPIFLNYALNCSCSQAQKSQDKMKLKVVHISASNIGDVLIALPPISEQKIIADYIERIDVEIENSINKKALIIKKLQEYKKSLIYEVVTGKKEV